MIMDTEKKAFVAGILLASTEYRGPINAAEAAIILSEFTAERIDFPEGLTAAEYARLWNDML